MYGLCMINTNTGNSLKSFGGGVPDNTMQRVWSGVSLVVMHETTCTDWRELYRRDKHIFLPLERKKDGAAFILDEMGQYFSTKASIQGEEWPVGSTLLGARRLLAF